MFRKRSVRVTVELLDEVLKDVKERFYASDAPAYHKNLLKKITPVFHVVNRRKWDTVAQAWAVGKYVRKDDAKKALKLRQSTHPMLYIDGDQYFMLIQFNKGASYLWTRRGLRHVIAHELAHLLQIVVDKDVDGKTSLSNEATDHDEHWKRWAKQMGGTGKEIIMPAEMWC